MRKPASVEEFAALRQRILADRSSRPPKPTLVLSAGICGQASGANDLMRVIKRHLLARNLTDRVALRVTGCQGFCQMDPSIVVEPGDHLYPKLRMEDVPRIIDATLDGHVVEELIYRDPVDGKMFLGLGEIPFFKKQTRTLLGNNQKLDPIRIHDYLEQGGYAALEKVLARNDPAWVVAEVKASGLRGRGGAGFPTGLKWERARAEKDGRGKFMVCNCDEGDPGAYMDRSLLEGNPHAIIEGMLIAAFAIGASHGVVYVRSEYPLAIKHTVIAIGQARALGLLGRDVLGTGFDFDLEIVKGAGAFVCGEETALIRSVMGYAGEPRQRPPYPIQKGIENRPTCINNVETLANVPVVIGKGAAEYAKVGLPGNTGTKIFSVVGKIRNTGLVEVPLGTTIREVVHDIGGGAPGKAQIKAVQTGGPSGGCIPASLFDLPIDYDSLAQAGSIMGSGGMIVMDDHTCMVDVAKYFMHFLKDESCGKCFTCRKGTQRMWEILDDVTAGRATLDQLDLLRELAVAVKDTSMCGLGQSAPNPVLSTLRYFRKEYEEHVVNRRCPAYVCDALVGAPCQTACPIGTEAWRYVAHVARGEEDLAYQAIREANPFPSVCARVCNHPCEERCRAGTTGGEAVAIRALKRYVTDRSDPLSYRPKRTPTAPAGAPPVAVVGSGPAGLTAAHYLSLRGYKVTVMEQETEPGGMLFSAIPSYRLPHDVVKKEIASLLDENVTLRCGTTLGRDVTLDELFEQGYGAVFLALGAHKSLHLGLPDEDAAGVLPSIQFLKAWNLRGQSLGRGRVVVVGGGNSAIDAARVARRQEGVTSVTLLYRRTREEMPAFEEEVEAALQEGVSLVTLAAPVKIVTSGGRVTAVECIKNALGERDASGRPRPVPIAGSEFTVPAETLVVAISEGSDTDCVAVAGANRIATTATGTVKADRDTLTTNRPGVFAGGDVVTGPNTVVDAIAAGKRAAAVIDRYLRREPLAVPAAPRIPDVFVAPPEDGGEAAVPKSRVALPRLAPSARERSFAEVEVSLPAVDAAREARRCLRCDLTFTQKPKAADEVPELAAAGGAS